MSVVDERKLFVAGLAEVVTEDVLRQLFEAAGGAVDEVTIPRDRATGKSRGFGFVTMASEAGAAAARESLDGSIQAGRSISVRNFRADRSSTPPSRASNAPPPASDATLYLGNLPFDATPQDVEELFREAGFDNVVRVHLPTDADKRPRGFGFVTLASAEAARAAAEQMQLAAMRGRSLSVSIARSRGTAAVGGRSPRAPRGAASPAPAPAREAVSYRQAPPPEEFRELPPPSWDDAGRGARREKEGRKKEKKRKARLATERSGRRRNEGFRAPRSRGMLDDSWDDD